MFWLGFVIALLGGLLSIGLSRDKVKQRYSVVRDYHLDVCATVLLVLGLLASAFEHHESERAITVLQKAQAPWELAPQQKEALSSQLKKAPKGKVAIEYIRSDEIRSRDFAVKIKSILEDSGYHVWGYMAGFMQADAPPLVGIRISIKDEKSDIVGGGLQRAFKAIGINAERVRRAVQDATYEDDYAVIYVGRKP